VHRAATSHITTELPIAPALDPAIAQNPLLATADSMDIDPPKAPDLNPLEIRDTNMLGACPSSPVYSPSSPRAGTKPPHIDDDVHGAKITSPAVTPAIAPPITPLLANYAAMTTIVSPTSAITPSTAPSLTNRTIAAAAVATSSTSAPSSISAPSSTSAPAVHHTQVSPGKVAAHLTKRPTKMRPGSSNTAR
jgi:hypothetical protein